MKPANEERMDDFKCQHFAALIIHRFCDGHKQLLIEHKKR